MKTYQEWKKRGGKRSLRALAVMLCFCLLITACPYMPGAVSVRAATATPGTITSNQEWGEQTLAAGTYTINSGVTVTVSGRLTVSGNVTIKGGGKLVRGSSYKGISSSGSASQSCIFYVSGGTLTLENVTVDGNNVEAYGPAIYISSGTVNMKTDAVIQNNKNMNTGGIGTCAAGGIYCGGTLNIDGGTIRNCYTSKKVESDKYANAGGGIYLKGTCNMSAGSITDNGASYGGGIYLASTGAKLNLSGGKISGNSAAKDGNGIYYSTLNAATSKLYISGDANVKDTIYLDNTLGELYPYITSTLHYPVTLSCSSTEEGKILAGGSDGYFLTSVDASKISMTGTSLYSRLKKTANGNQIYLSATEEPEAKYQESAGGAWKTGRFTTALEKVYDGGTIKLLTAVVIADQTKITKSVTITSDNASEPCIMTRMPSGKYGNITITGNGHLTLTNVIYDGNRDYLQGAEGANTQSLIKVGDGASDTGTRLTLGSGAVVRDGYKTGGSGLFAVYGTMTMNDGAVIENCEAMGTGGGVWVSSSGTFTMNGGTIRGCKAGGGGSAISIDGTCTLKGGSITGNTDTSDKECAVYLRSTGSGNLTLNGICISGNTYSVYNDGKNVSVAGDSTLSGGIYTTNAITANGNAMSSLTKTYAIMLPHPPTTGTIVVSGSKDTQHYQLDNTGYGLSQKSDGSSNLVVALATYTVTYNKNSGTIANESNYTSYTYGTGLTLPTPTRTGYTFGGWYTSAGFTGTAVTKISTTDMGNKTYYAKWTANTYTVTYNKNSGTIANESNYTSYTYGTGLTLPTPTRTGYTFGGWYTSSDFSGTAVTKISTTDTGNKTYYAKWTANTYTVTYNKNSGTITNESNYTSYTYGTGLTLPTPTRTGYTFGGWYESAGFTGTAVTKISNTDTGAKKYWAKWTDNIAPVIGTLGYSYKPKNLWQWLIGKESLIITVPVTEKGSGADDITYTVTPEGGTASEETSAIVNGKAQITVSAEFKGTIAITCTDKAGNTSASVTIGTGLNATGIIIEDNAPQITFQANGGDVSAEAYDSAPDITVTVTDDKDNAISAGIASVTYQIGNSEKVTVQQDFTTSMKTSATFTIPADKIPEGDTEITVKAMDHAGNAVDTTQTVRVKLGADKVAAAKKVVEEILAEIIATNDTTKDSIQEVIDSALEKAGISGVTVTVGDLEKQEATKSEPGSISGDISIECGSERAEVSVEKTIEQIPLTDADKVAAAKGVVEEALSGIIVTNDTTKGNIQEMIDGALTKAGITDVTVTVGDLEKQEATESEPGSVSGSIAIVSDNDSSVTDSVPIIRTIAKLPHTHDYGTKWKSDEISHWHECKCGEKKDIAVHTEDNGIVTKQPTETETGIRTYKCTACGYAMRTEQIPATGGGSNPGGEAGKVDKDVETDGKAPDTQISASAKELADMLLTEEEKEQVESGTNIRIVLDVQDASDSVSSTDKALVEAALNGYTTGQYLDISLFKIIGDSRSAIFETDGKITITITVPDSLKNTDSKTTRTFAVIRVHDGQTEVLTDLDSSADTITIETDRFSTYAIVYKETANGGSDNDHHNNDNNGSDNDNNDNGVSNNDGSTGDNGVSNNNGSTGDNGVSNNNGGTGDNGVSNNNGNTSDNGVSNNNGNTGDNGGGNNNASNSDNDNNNDNGISNNNNSNGNNNSNSNTPDNNGTKSDSSKDDEPDTGDSTPTPLVIYATPAMIAGFAYLLLYFADRRRGMTEETKKELVSRLIGWAKRGRKIRKLLALAAIFVLLVYYHSIGKKTCVKWKEVYGE